MFSMIPEFALAANDRLCCTRIPWRSALWSSSKLKIVAYYKRLDGASPEDESSFPSVERQLNLVEFTSPLFTFFSSHLKQDWFFPPACPTWLILWDGLPRRFEGLRPPPYVFPPAASKPSIPQSCLKRSVLNNSDRGNIILLILATSLLQDIRLSVNLGLGLLRPFGSPVILSKSVQIYLYWLNPDPL